MVRLSERKLVEQSNVEQLPDMMKTENTTGLTTKMVTVKKCDIDMWKNINVMMNLTLYEENLTAYNNRHTQQQMNNWRMQCMMKKQEK